MPTIYTPISTNVYDQWRQSLRGPSGMGATNVYDQWRQSLRGPSGSGPTNVFDQWKQSSSSGGIPRDTGLVSGGQGSGAAAQYLGAIGPNIGMGSIPYLNELNIGQQQAANQARIPGAAGLEAQSSADIAALLNPPAMFPEVDRRAAEVSAGRGIAGSSGAGATGVRMTDEERLRRMALGEQFLSAATARNPAAPIVDPMNFVITPYQQAGLDLQRYLGQQRYSTSPYGGSGFRGGAGGGPEQGLDLNTALGLLTPPATRPSYGGGSGSGALSVTDPLISTPPPGTYYDPLTNSDVYSPGGTPFINYPDSSSYDGQIGWDPDFDPDWDPGEWDPNLDPDWGG